MNPINIKNDVIFGRVYKLSNMADNYIYIGSTILTLRHRFSLHINDYNRNRGSNLYNHMKKVGTDNWTIELLEGRVIENIFELRQIEQKWINKYNKKFLLNEYDAINKNTKKRNRDKLNRQRNQDLLNELKNFNLNDD